MDGGEEHSSIIIDTKVTTGGIPIMTKKQREEFLKRNQGQESESEDNEPKLNNEPKVKKVNMKAQMDLQNEITQIIFKYIEQGSIEKL